MRHARAVCLDLDDTLWAIGPVIGRAETRFHEWLADRYPRVAAAESPASLRLRRDEIAAERPASAHDFLTLRRELYRRLAREAGYPEAMAEEASAEFQRLRNQVTLYDDVLPALAELRSGRLLVALTNGNADLDVIGLSGHFDAIFTAAQVGAAKPDPRVYRAVCEALDLVAEQVIHAGDDPERDVIAARAFGMPAVWINRAGRRWPDAHPAPEHEVADLLGLAALLRP